MSAGKHVRQSDFDGRWILSTVLIILVVVQMMMCSKEIRSKLSIVDIYEGQRITSEKNNHFVEGR